MIRDTEIIVYTGEIAIASSGTILISSPLGSCIAVCAYDPVFRVGGMAHVMLPGQAPESVTREKTRYAENALESLFKEMREKGAAQANLQTCLVGGANVLRRENDTIHVDNLASIISCLQQRNIPICRCSTGGFERMSARLDHLKGRVYNSIGNGPETPLFDFHAGPVMIKQP